MYIDNFLSIATKLLKDKADLAKDSVTSGSLSNFEDYRFATGKIFAYQDSIELLRECFAQLFERKTIISRRDENGNEREFED